MLLKQTTRNDAVLWRSCRGFAPDDVASKVESAMLDWLSDLTDALSIWVEKGDQMSEGELILARTNMGAIVESWLRLFYCVFYEDYQKQPLVVKGKPVDPDHRNMRFEDLKEYSIGILWDSNTDPLYLWVDKIQRYRNAIHSFRYRDIGTANGFMGDMDSLCDFVAMIRNRLPPIEDYIDVYPAGYTPINYLLLH